MDDVPARLIVKRGPEPKKQFTIFQEEATIGRSKKNVVVLLDPEVSRKHARLHRDGDIYLIEDLGSTNGTFINDQRITVPTALYNGDEIRFGDAILLQFWHMAEDPESPPMPEYGSMDPNATMVDSLTDQARENFYPQESSPSSSQYAQEFTDDQFYMASEVEEKNRSRRWLWGCGCVIFILVFLCGATLFFLDSYEQGRLLYCGPLRPFLQLILGPLGFAPACL